MKVIVFKIRCNLIMVIMSLNCLGIVKLKQGILMNEKTLILTSKVEIKEYLN